MKWINQSFFSPRVVLAFLSGVAGSILFISFIRNYVLATVLGMLLAASIANLSHPKEFALLGFMVGSVSGLYLVARNYVGEQFVIYGYPGLFIAALLGFTLGGLLCTGYGFLIGKLLVLYKKGQGPFF